MASKAKSKSAPASPAAPSSRREMLNDRHAQQAVERFKTSAKGFRSVFGGHFPERVTDVETLAFHLAQFEAHLPNTVEAIRLARYPGAGKRNPRRMALGLCENLSVLKAHLSKSIAALERISNGRAAAKPAARRRK